MPQHLEVEGITLKNCPCCNGKAIFEEQYHDMMDEVGEIFGPFWIVDCSKCGLTTSDRATPADAVRVWNTRATVVGRTRKIPKDGSPQI